MAPLASWSYVAVMSSMVASSLALTAPLAPMTVSISTKSSFLPTKTAPPRLRVALAASDVVPQPLNFVSQLAKSCITHSLCRPAAEISDNCESLVRKEYADALSSYNSNVLAQASGSLPAEYKTPAGADGLWVSCACTKSYFEQLKRCEKCFTAQTTLGVTAPTDLPEGLDRIKEGICNLKTGTYIYRPFLDGLNATTSLDLPIGIAMESTSDASDRRVVVTSYLTLLWPFNLELPNLETNTYALPSEDRKLATSSEETPAPTAASTSDATATTSVSAAAGTVWRTGGMTALSWAAVVSFLLAL